MKQDTCAAELSWQSSEPMSSLLRVPAPYVKYLWSETANQIAVKRTKDL